MDSKGLTQQIREKLLEAGVKNLKSFGYLDVTKDNILTDYVYSRFFRSMLEDDSNIGKSRSIESARLVLLKEVSG